MPKKNKKKLFLDDGSKIAVIGGGPAGSFFSYFALDFAKRFGIGIDIDIIEQKDFNCSGPAGCNHCGGIVSESLIQMLSAEGVVLPSKLIRSGIESYTLHIEQGTSVIEAPFNEQKIASLYRGIGPKDFSPDGELSFDNYLLELCKDKGATIIKARAESVNGVEDGIIVKTSNQNEKKYDFLVGAAGVNKKTLQLFKTLIPSLTLPTTTKTYISEFKLGEELVEKYFGKSMHVFLLNIPNVKFGAIIPKGEYVALVLLGKGINKEIVSDFLNSDSVRKCFPANMEMNQIKSCQCYPAINIRGAKSAYHDRIILIGDSSSSKLYKNGIGAAYITGKAAATTAVFMGISKSDFHKYYRPVCRNLDRDNRIGKFIFGVTSLIQKSGMIKSAMMKVVTDEQRIPRHKRHLSSVLWDTFTGSASYRNIFLRCLNPMMIFSITGKILDKFTINKPKTFKMKSKALGRRYRDGEMIIKQGDVGDCIYVIQEGKVEVFNENQKGEIKIAELCTNEFFGEMGLFEKDVRSCTIRACGEAKILTIDRRNFYKTIHKDPTLAYNLLQKMSYRLREINKKLNTEIQVIE
jgi:flavin-dependent dehydrogenase